MDISPAKLDISIVEIAIHAKFWNTSNSFVFFRRLEIKRAAFSLKLYEHSSWFSFIYARLPKEKQSGLNSISYPEPSNFLQRMLDENEGLWKGLVFRGPRIA